MPQSRSWRWAVFAFSMLLTLDAWARAHSLSGTHVTRKSPEHVWQVLTAYSQTCASGCRYERPKLVQVKRVGETKSETIWYTWSHVSNPIRDVTYFSRVTVRWQDNGGFVLDTLQLDESHRDIINDLSKQTGLGHRPAFDTANTRTSVSPKSGKTTVTQKVTLTTSGVLDLWPAKVDEGIVEHMSSTFRNIGP